MASEPPPEPAVEPAVDEVPVRRVIVQPPLWQRIVKWGGITLGSVVLALSLLVLALNTDMGRRFVVDQIARLELASGLNFRIGRIDGSLYGGMALRDVEVRDNKGTFATAQVIELDWRPLSYLRNRVDIRRLASPEVRILRRPALKPSTDPNAPLLPNINLDIDRLEVARIDIAPAVTGRHHIARLAGTVHLAGGRAQVVADAATIAAPGVAGGDRLTLKLDAVPDQNKLDIDLKLDAPAKGLVAGLAGIETPLTLAVAGQGSWASWKGRAVSTLGGKEFANLDVTANNGRFQLRGPTNPGLWMKGPVERLASPRLDVALDAVWKNRTANGQLKLRSRALSVEMEGGIDLGHNRFDNLRADAILLTPGAIAPNLSGRSLRAALALNGAFNRPVVDYKIQAAALGFGTTVAEQLFAEGRARVDADRILVPVRARAARVTGLNAALGGLVTNLTINGDLAISGSQILSDNLRLRSDRVDATAIVAADIAKGRYTGALRGRINDYAINGVGVVNLTTDAQLYAPRGGGWGIRGTVAAETRKLTNASVRNFLGGNAVASAHVTLGPSGVIDVTNLRLRAPQFRILSGSGRYDPAGPILINANAVSTAYGPLTARVTGTLNAPQVLLRAERPGLGVGLVNLEARIRGRGSAFAIAATGGTDYGPFSANVLLRTGAQMSVDIESARFAGMDITGRLRQTRAGPFAGNVDFQGSGIVGTADLSAQGRFQRADLRATATNATIPGNTEFTIGRALVSASVVLTETPQIVADAQIAGLRRGDFVLKTARAKIDYQGGSGTAQAVATGSSGVPFQIGINARMAPDQWLAAVQGEASGIRFRTAQPARIATTGGSYRLLPTRVDFDRGSVRLAGSYGDGMVLQARLDRLEIAVLNAFVPGLGADGTASGSIDFAQPTPSAFPRADVRLEIDQFTRSSLATVSTPVDISFVGKLLPDGGDARAILKRGSTTVGRVVVTLRPLGPEAGSWTERLMAAPLSGGIRYNGPAAVPFSLAGLSNQHLDGAIGIAADFSGRVRDPHLAGVVRADNLSYGHDTYGTRLTNLKIDGRFSDDEFILNQASARAGEGTVTAQGRVGLSAANNYPMSLEVDLNNAQLARGEALGATATGRLTLTKNAQIQRIEGRLTIPEARYEIIRQGAAEVPELTGIRRRSEVAEAAANPRPQVRPARALTDFDLNIRLVADNRIFVSGMGLESEWGARIYVRGTTNQPQIRGNLQIVRGTYSFASRRFEITEGDVSFQGAELSNPTIRISANTTAEGITAVLDVSGTAQNPHIVFSSTPALPQEEVLARLFFGTNVTNLSATEAIQLAAAVNSLSGSGGGLNPLGQLRSATGIDRLRILGADDATGRGTSLAAGKYITSDIYIEIITDARGFTATQLEISLSRTLSLLSQTGSFGGSSVSLRYSRDY